MKVCVVGMGYIGLPTSLMMASHGVDVVGVDYDPAKIEKLRAGQVTFEEKGLDELFERAVRSGITFESGYPRADMYVISVPTPYDKRTKKIDPSYVVSAVDSVLGVCPQGSIVSIESTISPGTIDRYVRPAVEAKGFTIGKDVHLAHTPERIIPGNMVYELEHNSRTIGVDDPETGEAVRSVYSSFCQGDMVITDIRTAEMTKVVENTYRDINIAFANELARICRRDGMDVYEIIRIANMHPRVNILQPGPGVGGHCISVDPWFLVGDYPEQARLIHQARLTNDGMPDFVLDRIETIMKMNKIRDVSRVGLYGLTYKENVDDVRESPTLQLLERPLTYGMKVYDPWVSADIVDNQYHDLDAFLKDVDLVVIMVGHKQLRDNIDVLKGKIIFDTRNVCPKGLGVYKL
ncbi:MAG: nucleotide sugar dehydrogenase [Firmicutes bacterium]|nr:nucleotide sugar dehydrogenase [Bacillota bacterium]